MRGQLVVRLDPTPSQYVEVDVDGAQQRPLDIPANQLAGFSRDFKRVALADQGALGSGHEDTLLSVSPLGSAHPALIWKVGDDLTTAPAWSPTGKKLAFGMTRIESRGGQAVASSVAQGLWTVDSDGGHPRLLVAGEIGSVAWSPDGSRLAFVVYGYPQAQLETVPSGGGTPTLLASIGTDHDAQPIAWSPDGGRILLARTTYKPGGLDWDTSGVDAYPAGGGAPHVVLASQDALLYSGVVYSPDGSQIAISALTRAPQQQPNATVRFGDPSPPSALHSLLIANADGSAAMQVASFPSLAEVVGWFPR